MAFIGVINNKEYLNLGDNNKTTYWLLLLFSVSCKMKIK